jgi:hypothetical protein
MASLARITALLAGAFVLFACGGTKTDPNAGRADATQACEAWDGALQNLSNGNTPPKDAARQVEEAAGTADKAASANSRWTKLARDLRLASLQIGSLDAERARNETTYVFNGPAAQIIDAVNADCEPLTGG